MSTSLGWTWEQAGDLDLPRLAHYSRTWAQYPPVHVTLAHLGRSMGALKPYTPPRAKSTAGEHPDDLGELLKQFPVMSTPGLDSSQMTPEEIEAEADRLFFGQPVKDTL